MKYYLVIKTLPRKYFLVKLWSSFNVRPLETDGIFHVDVYKEDGNIWVTFPGMHARSALFWIIITIIIIMIINITMKWS